MDDLLSHLKKCELCPRRCKVNRFTERRGYCMVGSRILVAHHGPHFGEEPPITGEKGSGNIFFSSCNLRCVYCQNFQISHHMTGTEYDISGLTDLFFSLAETGVHNINLVSPTPYIPLIASAIKEARKRGFTLPFVYNSNAYENVEALKFLHGLIDIYLPDFKYASPKIAKLLSDVKEYPQWAKKAILEMKSQVGNLVIENGIARKGILVRHLVLPNNLSGSKEVIGWIKDNLGTETFLSLMSQYFPLHKASAYPMLDRKLTEEEYEGLLNLLNSYGFENVYIQELESAPCFLPDFNKEKPFDKTDQSSPPAQDHDPGFNVRGVGSR